MAFGVQGRLRQFCIVLRFKTWGLKACLVRQLMKCKEEIVTFGQTKRISVMEDNVVPKRWSW